MQSVEICSHWKLLIYTGIASFPVVLFFIYDAFSSFPSCGVTASNLVLKCIMTGNHETNLFQGIVQDSLESFRTSCKVVKVLSGGERLRRDWEHCQGGNVGGV